jgi:methylmalonyl-CoA/ethylmalonyl-CoA epimerase
VLLAVLVFLYVNIPSMLLTIDHVGIACRSLDAAIERYVSVFGLAVVSQEINAEQGVREAMLATDSGGSYVQLLEPLGEDTPVGRFLSRRGEGMHHVGYAVTDVTAALAEIGGRGGVRLLDSRPRHGSMGASIAFLHPGDLGGVLTELVQSFAAPGELCGTCGVTSGTTRGFRNVIFWTGIRDPRGACDLYTFSQATTRSPLRDSAGTERRSCHRPGEGGVNCLALARHRR